MRNRFITVLTVVLLLAISPAAFAAPDTTVGTNRPLNPEVPGIKRADGSRSAPTITGKPDNYSGVSGPGQPVTGTGWGGYRSGREGLMYRGPDPKAGWLDLVGRPRGTAVTDGLIPPLRPIWDLHLRDTSVCLAEDGFYYMTGSSGDNIWDLVDGVELWRSTDLQKWDYLGLVWSVDKDGTWEKQYRWVWAPEVHVVNHVLAITYCMVGPTGGGGTGVLITKSGKPEGPYINPITADKPLTGGIDATIFQDDDGSIYFTNGAGGRIHKMKPDLSAFDTETFTTSAVPEPNGPKRLGHEGASLFKANGKYYLGAADTYQGRYSSICGVADNIRGPYKRVTEGVPCGAGGNYFKDKSGNWWCTYFGNDDQSPWREKPGIVKVDFDSDGSIFVADDQPAFVLQSKASPHWRRSPRTPSTRQAATQP